MTPDLEDELRRLFADDADRTAAPPDLASQSRRRARRQRGHRALLLTTSAAAVVAGVLGVAVLDRQGPGAPGDGSGTAGAASCVEEYSPDAVTGRAFALDGTVRAIDASASYSFERRLTLDVTHWYSGRSALGASAAPGDDPASVVIDAPAPDGAGGVSSGDGSSYDVGDRLLVSGEIRTGPTGPLGPIAWGCGFTSPYDPATARAWEAAFAPGA